MAVAANPWDGPSLGLELGDPARILTLGWKHRLMSSSLQDGDDKLEREVKENSSIKLVQVLEEISKITSEIHQLEEELCQHKLDKSMADFTHVDQLEDRLTRLDGWSDHLTQIAQGKQALLRQLQTKSSKNSLAIEASCQQQAHAVLKGVGPSLQQFPTHSSLVDWERGASVESSMAATVGPCQQVEETLTYCQNIYHTLDQLHRTQLQN